MTDSHDSSESWHDGPETPSELTDDAFVRDDRTPDAQFDEQVPVDETTEALRTLRESALNRPDDQV